MKFFWQVRAMLHVVGKIVAFACFGLGSLVLGVIIVPLLRLFIHPTARRQRVVRRVIRTAFQVFVLWMKVLRLIRVRVTDIEKLKDVRGAIICSNHPTLIDVVILLTYLPDPTCLVKSSLWKNPLVKNVIGSVYVPNSLGASETFEACKASLAQGSNLVLFPEGTRTDPAKVPKFHKTAAYLSMKTGSRIVPIHIETTRPSGLGKGDPIFASPPRGIIDISIMVNEFIGPELVSDGTEFHRAQVLTDYLKKAIL